MVFQSFSGFAGHTEVTTVAKVTTKVAMEVDVSVENIEKAKYEEKKNAPAGEVADDNGGTFNKEVQESSCATDEVMEMDVERNQSNSTVEENAERNDLFIPACKEKQSSASLQSSNYPAEKTEKDIQGASDGAVVLEAVEDDQLVSPTSVSSTENSQLEDLSKTVIECRPSPQIAVIPAPRFSQASASNTVDDPPVTLDKENVEDGPSHLGRLDVLEKSPKIPASHLLVDTSSASAYIESVKKMEAARQEQRSSNQEPTVPDPELASTKQFLSFLGLGHIAEEMSTNNPELSSVSSANQNGDAEVIDTVQVAPVFNDAAISKPALLPESQPGQVMDVLMSDIQQPKSDAIEVDNEQESRSQQEVDSSCHNGHQNEGQTSSKRTYADVTANPEVVSTELAKKEINRTPKRRWPCQEELKKLLELYCLLHFYPGKLTLEKVKERTLCPPPRNDTPSFVILRFLYKIMHNCVDARDELLSHNLDSAVNSADVLLCILLVGDDFLRQEMFVKMAMLQYAIPLCYKNATQLEPVLLNWSLRSVVKRWKSGKPDCKSFIEDDLHSGRFAYCSFLRLGSLPYSKSKMLNKLFPKGNDPFTNSEDDDIPRSLSDGSIEFSWLLPVRDECFEPIAVANLRGDALEHPDLLEFLTKQSSTIFVFVGEGFVKSFVSVFTGAKDRVVFITSKKARGQNTISEMLLNEGFRVIDETEARLPLKIKNEMVSPAKKLLSFQAWERTAKNFGFALEDEKESIRKGRKGAEAVLDCTEARNRALSLPLQLKEWREYAQAHKEQLRMKKKPEKTSVSDYCKRLRDQKSSLRAAQSRKVLPQPFVIFVQYLVSKPSERRFFLWWLGYFLDKQSRTTDKNIIGLEHFLRELAQVYEVHVETSPHSKRGSALTMILEQHGKDDPRPRISSTVADMLLEGHPIELLDGDAQGILEVWTKDLMSALSLKMKNGKRIGVVSVLGVQSSGKSTLLNAMFGCRFTVSSGRCTRGVNMQLIKVGKISEDYGIEYILVLDSEGLKSPEKQDLAGSTEHDSELGTLVVGLSDVVVINVASESMDALKDIIQITIHAFIRMKHTNRQKTKCFFVHQNTGDPSNFEKLKNERMIFEKTLQELTDIAVRMEFPGMKVEKDFRTILDYGKEDSHEYFPGLFNGTPPMAPINPGYSEKVMSVKNIIMKALKNGMKLTPEQFGERVADVWQAVLMEDFIFSFKNSLIASKRSDLDEKIAAWEWEFRQEMKEFFESLQTEILNEKTLPTVAKYARKIQASHSEKLTVLLNRLEAYLKQDPVAHQYFFEEARASAKTFVSRAEAEMMHMLTNFIKNEEMKRKVDEKQTELDNLIQTRITSLVEQFKREGKELNKEEACEEFEVFWAEQLEDLKRFELQSLKELDIDAEVQYLLLDFLPQKDHMSIKQLMSEKPKLSDYVDCTIQVTSEDFHYQSAIKDAAQRAVSKAVTYLTGGYNGPGSLSNHLEPVEAFVRAVVKKYEHWIVAYLRDPNFRLESVAEMSRELFRQVKHAVSKYPGNQIYLAKDLQMRILVRIAAFYVTALEDFRVKYLNENDPALKLQKQKDYFRNLFLSLCASRSIASAAAGKFIDDCLLPGLLDTVRLTMDRIMAKPFKEEHEDLRNRKTCEISMFNYLKNQANFHLYLDVIHQYKDTITSWLRRRMDEYYKRACPCDLCLPYGRSRFIHLLCEHWDNSQLLVRKSINTILNQEDEPSFLDVLEMISTLTRDKLVLRTGILEPFADSTDPLEFCKYVLTFMDDPSRWTLSTDEVYEQSIERAIDFLVGSLIGCGQACPFCGAPCGRNSSQHAEHAAEFHRPQVIGGYCYEGSEDAMIETCPAYIASGKSFKNQHTKWRFVTYRDYKNIYPDWNIPPDTAIESGMFWKWALVTRASEFALYYGFNVESLPRAWKDITWDMVSQELTAQLQGTQNDEEDETE